HIQRALDLIEKNHNRKITVNDISLHDPGIYAIMSKGDTAGIFQFEGDGITDAIKKIRPTGFADITAINALYRPGPMAMIPEFAKRKNKEASVEFLFPELKESLEETYGIIVYQEQVMAIASHIAGYSLGEADMLRRAMGKKIKEEMDQHRARFLKGASERNFDKKKSEELFDLMYKFADYGFNKSHAAAYCVVAAQTAWLKNYYPVEFFAALLTTELGDTDKVVKYVKDAQKRNIEVLPPHINHSDYHFTAKGNQIYFGLGAIKGVGETAVQSILEARSKKESQEFEDLAEFFKCVDLRKVNKKVIESLIKAGGFDGFGFHRAQLMLGYSKLLDQAIQFQKDDQIGQSSFFESFETAEESSARIELDPVRPWNQAAQLSYEKDVLGFYLSDHPLRGLEKIQAKWTSLDLGSLQPEVKPDLEVETKSDSEALPSLDQESLAASAPVPAAKHQVSKRRVTVGGIISGLKDVITKKGTRMAFGRIEDQNGSCEIVFFPDSYAKHEAIIKQEKPMLIGGFLEQGENSAKIIADQVALYDDLLKKTKTVKIDLNRFDEKEMFLIKKIISERPGSTVVHFQMKLDDLGKQLALESVGEKLSIQFDHDFINDLQGSLGRTDFIEI
ncbi:MAG: DNA polymerase III subunit alpha, partial [Pseudobdellovibrionaceae bacterium]